MDDDLLRKHALQWVGNNKTQLFEEVIIESNFIPDTDEYPPAASFMAGTPGAGKTEVSKRFLAKFTTTPIRIDADDFRQKIPGYNGANSNIIQPAAALAVDKILEKIFEKKYSFMLDGTFAIGKAVEILSEPIDVIILYKSSLSIKTLSKPGNLLKSDKRSKGGMFQKKHSLTHILQREKMY